MINSSHSSAQTAGIELPQNRISNSARSWREVVAPPGDLVSAPAGLNHSERLPRFIAGPSDAPARLRALWVVVVAGGSVGGRIIDSLARMGVGRLLICDPRDTKRESLLTHLISPEEVGVSKARLMASRAKSLSPNTRVSYFAGSFELLPLDAVADASAVIISTDNLAAEVAVSEACLHLGKPHYQASVYGPGLVAQVRSLPGGDDAAGPCLACNYGGVEWDELDRGTRFSCEGGNSTAAGAAPRASALPTTSPPHLCSLAADLTVGELLRDTLGLGPRTNSARSLLFSGYTGDTLHTELRRNPRCPIDHTRWSVRLSDSPLAEATPRDVARIASRDDTDLRTISLRVDHHRFASFSTCNCDAHPQLGRFLADDQELGRCNSCGSEQSLHPLHTHRDVPGRALEKHLDRSLGKLGVAATPTVLVRGPHCTTLLRSPGQALPSLGQSTHQSTSTRPIAADAAMGQKVSHR